MKVPYFVSLFPHKGLPLTAGAASLMDSVGHNTGNLLFTEALHRIVKTESYACGYLFDPDTLSERHDGIIVSAANWLSPGFDISPVVDAIEKTNLPVVIVGIGAQAKDKTSYPHIKPSTERLIKIASERSHSLSARGEYSADALNHYGVKNVNVTGCPSLLYHYGEIFSVNAVRKDNVEVAFHSTRHQLGREIFEDSVAARVNLDLFREAYLKGADIILQSEMPDLQVLLSGDQVEADVLTYLSEVYAGAEIDVVQYLKSHAKMFFGVEQWISYVRSKDFVVGTRIHGTVISILAGVPAVLVTHDARTEELATALSIPFIRSSQLAGAVVGYDWARLYEATSWDEFYSRYPNYVVNFRKFFEDNKILHNIKS